MSLAVVIPLSIALFFFAVIFFALGASTAGLVAARIGLHSYRLVVGPRESWDSRWDEAQRLLGAVIAGLIWGGFGVLIAWIGFMMGSEVMNGLLSRLVAVG